MKYAIISVVNGNFKVEAEYGTNKQGAFVGFHNTCAAFWNESTVKTATVSVVDENLDVVEGKIEYISHPEVEPNANAE